MTIRFLFCLDFFFEGIDLLSRKAERNTERRGAEVSVFRGTEGLRERRREEGTEGKREGGSLYRLRKGLVRGSEAPVDEISCIGPISCGKQKLSALAKYSLVRVY